MILYPKALKLAIVLGILGLSLWAANYFWWRSNSEFIDLAFRSINFAVLLSILVGFTIKTIPGALGDLLANRSRPYYQEQDRQKENKQKLSDLNSEYSFLKESFTKLEQQKIAQSQEEAAEIKEKMLQNQVKWEQMQQQRQLYIQRKNIAENQARLLYQVLDQVKAEYNKDPLAVDEKTIDKLLTEISKDV